MQSYASYVKDLFRYVEGEDRLHTDSGDIMVILRHNVMIYSGVDTVKNGVRSGIERCVEYLMKILHMCL